MREIITKTQQHVDIVQQATMRMSSRAETFGAIQQVWILHLLHYVVLNIYDVARLFQSFWYSC